MSADLIAKAATTINAPSGKVWEALVQPEAIKQYMFGTTAVSDWHEGSPIVWKGPMAGQNLRRQGLILQFKPERTLHTAISARSPACRMCPPTITRSPLSYPASRIRPWCRWRKTTTPPKKSATMPEQIGR